MFHFSCFLLYVSLLWTFKPLTFILLQNEYRIKHAQKLREIGHLLCKVCEDDPFEGLIMIDALQRLSIDYRFQDEINGFLEKRSMNPIAEYIGGGNLYGIALQFRLLRQEGYFVHAGDYYLLLCTNR